MVDSVAKGVGEQLGQLGKQIVTEVAKTPAKIVGIDETLGSGGTSPNPKNPPSPQKKSGDANSASIEALKQKDELEKARQLQKARELLKQFTQLQGESDSTYETRLKMEELEKKKKEIVEEKKKAMKLPFISTRPERGNLYGRGVRPKSSGTEVGKNIKSQ